MDGIILKASQGSAFFINEQRKHALTADKVAAIQKHAIALKSCDELHLRRVACGVQQKVSALERIRDLSRIMSIPIVPWSYSMHLVLIPARYVGAC